MSTLRHWAGRVARGVPRRMRRAAFELAGRPLPIPGMTLVPTSSLGTSAGPFAEPPADPAPVAAPAEEAPAVEPATAEPPAPLPDVGLLAIGLHGWYRDDWRAVYPDVPVGPGDVVADIGCGDGGSSWYCAAAGARVIMSDLDAERLEKASNWVRDGGPDRQVEALHGNGEKLPIADETASVTICTEVIEHVDSPESLCAELFRITRPGGVLLIACPDPRSEKIQQAVAAPLYFEKPNHIRIVQNDQFLDWVKGAGFEIVRNDTYGFYEAVRWAMFWKLDIELGQPHPVFTSWADTWRQLLALPGGPDVQKALDGVLPKSQVIVARRPVSEAA